MILRDIEIIKRELPLDLLEFFLLTPLPGSEDHKVLAARRACGWMRTCNKYDLDHRVSHHPKMSDAEWEEAYRAAWDAFYTPDHVRTVLRRSAASEIGRPRRRRRLDHLWFRLMTLYEDVHPLEGGAFRLKFRRDRRGGMKLESPFVFYPRYVGETLVKVWRYWRYYRKCRAILEDVLSAPDRYSYTDLAIEKPNAHEFEDSSLPRDTRRRRSHAPQAARRHEPSRRTLAGSPRARQAAGIHAPLIWRYSLSGADRVH